MLRAPTTYRGAGRVVKLSRRRVAFVSLQQARLIAEPCKNGSLHTDGRRYRMVTGFSGISSPNILRVLANVQRLVACNIEFTCRPVRSQVPTGLQNQAAAQRLRSGGQVQRLVMTRRIFRELLSGDGDYCSYFLVLASNKLTFSFGFRAPNIELQKPFLFGSSLGDSIFG